MMTRRLMSVESQARVFAFVWMLRDLHDSPYNLDREQLKWIYQELLATFHLTDAGMERRGQSMQRLSRKRRRRQQSVQRQSASVRKHAGSISSRGVRLSKAR